MMFVGMGASFVLWLFSTSLWPLAAFAFVYGVFYGGFVALAPAIVADYFGGRHAASLIGILYTSVAFGTLVGPSIAGFLFDASGSYSLPILLSIGTYVIATAVLAATSRTPISR
jgi:MFS family permease